MSLPNPVTVQDEYLAAILAELRALRQEVQGIRRAQVVGNEPTEIDLKEPTTRAKKSK